MRNLAWMGTVAACAALGCRMTTGPVATSSGVQGRVLRGPVTPVCVVGVPCDAPFAASFSVRQDGRTVATFRSDSTGAFLVWLPAGTYLIVPDAGAPIIDPGAQGKSVVVRPGAITTVELTFDTGIR
jgi:hypothetical protein